MADITITEVAPVVVNERQFTGPAGEAIAAGQYVRLDPTTGKIVKGNATTAAEARSGGIALTGAVAGQTVTVAAQGAVLDVGDVLGDLDYDADVYLSDTDGKLADATGTVTKVVGRVIPAWGHTTADKLLEIRMTEAIDVAFDFAASNLPTDFLQFDLVDGQNETSGPDLTYALTGIAVGDEIVFVGHISTKAAIATIEKVTGFTVTDDDEISSGSAVDRSIDQLLVVWIDRTP